MNPEDVRWEDSLLFDPEWRRKRAAQLEEKQGWPTLRLHRSLLELIEKR